MSSGCKLGSLWRGRLNRMQGSRACEHRRGVEISEEAEEVEAG